MREHVTALSHNEIPPELFLQLCRKARFPFFLQPASLINIFLDIANMSTQKSNGRLGAALKGLVMLHELVTKFSHDKIPPESHASTQKSQISFRATTYCLHQRLLAVSWKFANINFRALNHLAENN